MTNQLVPINRAPRLTLCFDDLKQLTGNDQLVQEPVSTLKIVEITLSEADLFEADIVLCECMTLFAQWTDIEEEEEVGITCPVTYRDDYDGLVMVFQTPSGTIVFGSDVETPAIAMAPHNSMASDATVSSTSSSCLLPGLESHSSSSIGEHSASSVFDYPESDTDSGSSSGEESDMDVSDSSASTVSVPCECYVCTYEYESACLSLTEASVVPSTVSSCIYCHENDVSSSTTGFVVVATSQATPASSPATSDDGVLQPAQVRVMLAECEEMIEKTMAMKMQLKKIMEENGWTEQ